MMRVKMTHPRGLEIRKKLSAWLTTMLVIGVTMTTADAQTRLGLHITEEELSVWQYRANNGPYKSTDDTENNNPGEWDKIASNAQAFLNDPDDERWIAPIAGDCFDYSVDPVPLAPRSQGEKIRDAAFYYLVKGGSSYLTAVRDELIAQTQEETTKFGEFDCSGGISDDYQRLHDASARMMKQLFAYDYVRNDLSPSDVAILDAWFFNAAEFFRDLIDTRLESHFQDRYATPKVPTSYAASLNCPASKQSHYGGWDLCTLAADYGNRTAIAMAFAGSVGIMLDDSVLKQSAKEFYKEFVTYSIYPDGVLYEMKRWVSNNEEQGWSYAALQGGAMVALADHFARIGDTSLYDFVSSGGEGDAEGGPKDLLLAMTNHVSYMDGTYSGLDARYATDDPNNVGNPDYMIDSQQSLGAGGTYVYDVAWVQGNVYYRSDKVQDAYRRESTSFDYPSSAKEAAGFNSWGGAWGIFPSELFMFGQMENEVWPYPTPSPFDWLSKDDFVEGTVDLGSANTDVAQTIEYDVEPLDDNIDGVTGYSDSSTTVSAYTDLSMIVRMNSSGFFDVRDGNTYASDASVGYSANTKYHVKIELDLNTETYDVWVTPDGGSETQIVDDYAFRTGAPSIDDIGQVTMVSFNDDEFRIGNHIVSPTNPGSLPSGWTSTDVGDVDTAGNATYDSGNGEFTVEGAGDNIWGTEDDFHYAYHSLNGDGEIIVRVTSMDNTSQHAKAGIMIRETLDEDSVNANLYIRPDAQVQYTSRTSTGGSSTYNNGAQDAFPQWLRLVRTGNTIDAYQSANGTSWSLVESESVSMASSVYIGLAVCSIDDQVLNEAVYDNVSVTP